jgi:DNA-binding MarR family transcriptional regulator
MSKLSRDELIAEFIDAVRASQTAVDMLDEAVADYLGLHRTDMRCLDILDREGPMTAGRLAEEARVSPGAMTTVLDRLEGKGLARRRRDTEDRRRVLVEVTPEMRKGAEELYGPPEEGAQALDVYSDDELEFLIAFLRGNIAYQDERMRRLEAMKARDASEPAGRENASRGT